MADNTIYTDKQYFADFEGRISTYSPTTLYSPGDIVEYNGGHWEAQASSSNSAPSSSNANWAIFVVPELGRNRFISLEDIVNNYMVLYADEANFGGDAMRHKMEGFAQRAVQEFNYDVLHVKDIEYTLIGSALFPFPQDLVEVASVSYVDESGLERRIPPRKDSSNPRSALQSNLGNFIYDSNNNATFSKSSLTQSRWNNSHSNRQNTTDNINGNLGFDDYGQRYYLNPETSNENGSYFVDHANGRVSFDASLMGETIVIKYVTDGLGDDFSQIRVHKFAEDAIYDRMYFDYISKRRDTHANEKERAKRKAYGSKIQAKHRLSEMTHREIIATVRNQNRWIKQ